LSPWIVTATVPATVFDVYDVGEVLDALAEFSPMLDGGTVEHRTGLRRPWRVTIEVPGPSARRAASTGVRVVEMAFGRRVQGYDVMTRAEDDARTSRAVDDLRAGPTPAAAWPGPCVP